MFAQQLSRALSARGIHYAWFVAALTFLFSTRRISTGPDRSRRADDPTSEEFGWNLGIFLPRWPCVFSCSEPSLRSLEH